MNAILARFDFVIGDAMPYRTAVRWTSVLLLATLGGCNGLHRTDQSARPKDSLPDSRVTLRKELHQFEKHFGRIAKATSKEVLGKPMSEEHRERVKSWRLRITQECNTAIGRDDPFRGLLDVWMLCRRARDHFHRGPDTTVLGEESREIVLDAAERTHIEIERIARAYLTEEAFQRMSQKVAEGANANPIRRTFADEPSFSDTEPGKDALEMLLGLFEIPVRAVGELLQTPFSAIRLAQGLEQASDVVENLPKEAREQFQLLADDLEGREIVRKAVDSFERFSKSSERLTQGWGETPPTAEGSPEGVDRSQPDWGATAIDVREAAQSIERTVERVPKTAQALEALAEAVGQVAKDFRALLATPEGPGESASSQKREPFNWQEVTESAEAGTQTVAELRALVRDLRDLLEPDQRSGGMGGIGTGLDRMGAQVAELRELVRDVRDFLAPDPVSGGIGAMGSGLDRIGGEIRGVVTHASVWVVLLMVLLFALVLIHRAITQRFLIARSAA